MTRVFITGGAGFIGSSTARQLLEQGHEVALYDSFVSYVNPMNRMHIDNITTRMGPLEGKVKIYRGGTQDQDFMRRALMDFKPQRVIHLAAMPLASMAIENPEEALQAIFQGTVNLLQILRDVPSFERMVYVSSSMVYGDFVRVPVAEDDPKDPKEVYGSMKLSGELVVKAFGRLFGLDCTIVRPSAVYGPTDNNRRVLGIFLENALLGKPLVVQGAANTLDFTYVDDAGQAIVKAALHPAASGRIYNITRGHGRTLVEAAKIIQSLEPKARVEIISHDNRMPVRGALDISRARQEIGYEPQVEIEEGLRRYHEFLVDQRRRGVW